MDIFASRNLTLQVGDRVMVVGPQDAVERVANLMGNSLKRLDHPNIVTIFVGIFLGIFFGSLPIAFPGIPTPVKLGLAGGPLIVSILIGRFGYKLKLVTYTTMSANLMLREIGIALFPCQCGDKGWCEFWEYGCLWRWFVVCGLWFPYYSYTFINNGSGCTLALQDELFHVDGAYCR